MQQKRNLFYDLAKAGSEVKDDAKAGGRVIPCKNWSMSFVGRWHLLPS